MERPSGASRYRQKTRQYCINMMSQSRSLPSDCCPVWDASVNEALNLAFKEPSLYANPSIDRSGAAVASWIVTKRVRAIPNPGLIYSFAEFHLSRAATG
jgi:hypothetical protein